jgi:ATP phosphoribosyltransferase
MKKLRMVVPKGSIQANVVELLRDAGLEMRVNERGYRPETNDPELEVKMMRPQDIPKLIEMGSHHVGFTGRDWVVETGADVAEVLDLRLDPVRIVAAVPEDADRKKLKRGKLVVATEYENIARSYLQKRRYNFVLLRTYGATEAFPPDDADMIIDNAASGRTLKEHGLSVISTIMTSSTLMVANRKALADPWKRKKVQDMCMLLSAVLDARERVILEMNVPKAAFEKLVKALPCMRSPTVAPLYGEEGYAVKVAVKRSETQKLIPRLVELGATDILEYGLRKVIVGGRPDKPGK